MKTSKEWAAELAREEGYGGEWEAAMEKWVRAIQVDALMAASGFCGGDGHIEEGIKAFAQAVENGEDLTQFNR